MNQAVFQPSSKSTWYPVLMIAGICMLYEWVGVFEIGPQRYIAMFLKIALPVWLLLKVKDARVPYQKEFLWYMVFFVLCMSWAIIPNLFSDDVIVSLQQWLKYVPRLFICFAIALCLFNREDRQIAIMKVFVVLGVLVVFQYVLLVLGRELGLASEFHMPSERGGVYYGPFGILGNGTGLLGDLEGNGQYVRLTSFWTEPSVTSGFIFMTVYLAMALYTITQDRKWKRAMVICLVGGLLTFSNAGYLAMFSTFAFGQCIMIVRMKSRRFLRTTAVVVCVLIAAGSLAVRSEMVADYIADRYGEYGVLIAMLRLQSRIKAKDVGGLDGGRTEDAARSLTGIADNPMGYGFRVLGKEIDEEVKEGSASAPLVWLLYAGVFGLILIVLREYQVVRFGIGRSLMSPYDLSLFQAYGVVLIQQLSYGTWMTPLLFTVTSLVFFSPKGTAPNWPFTITAELRA